MRIQGIVLEHHAHAPLSRGNLVTSCSPKKIWPQEGDRRPQIIFKVVLFPQPEGPKSPTSCPSGSSKEKWSTAVTSSCDFLPLAGNVLVRSLSTIFMIYKILSIEGYAKEA